MKYLVIYEQGPTSWGAYVPDLPGCAVVGETEDEVRALMRDALALHLEGMRQGGESIPPLTSRSEYLEAAG
ncbi:MAG: type II toxin-antitoxin system HicB family antitoxin [Candidatus Lambdaproteobacteria bacterium]|nr:type II toxin-antitoxin system HicB family antitoxin [Candidatus Lambdaproteobacteria bacterium]